MTVVYNPSLLANLNNPTTAVVTINNNETAVSSAFQQALNTSGDTMLGTINMNSNQIINLPAPASPNAPARLQDVAPAGTTLISALTYNNIQSLPALTILGNPTGVTANATAQTSITVNNAVFSTSVGTASLNASTVTATTGTLTNLSAATLTVTGNATTSGALDVNTIQYTAPGTPNNFYSSAASTGTVSEFQQSVSVVTINLTNNAISNILPSLLVLTPGDWDVWGWVQFIGTATNLTFINAAICNTINTFSTAIGASSQILFNGAPTIGSSTVVLPLGITRQLLASSQTYTLNVQTSVGAGACSCQGAVFARRCR
jgi:hypothetical protein